MQGNLNERKLFLLIFPISQDLLPVKAGSLFETKSRPVRERALNESSLSSCFIIFLLSL